MPKNKFDIITLGEIMLRLSPPRYCRISDSEIFEKRAGGSELNVAAGAALLGLKTGIISMLPQNDIATFIRNKIRFNGVEDYFLQYDLSDDARVGTYIYEMGAAPRKPTIVYDRKNASINNIKIENIPEYIYSDTRIFHTSGISLALSKGLTETVIEIIKRFKEGGAKISFDINYRANLWGEDEARETIKRVLPMIDILFVSEESSRRMFQKSGTLEQIQKSYCEEYGVSIVATTKRTVVSPKIHHFNSVIFDSKTDTYYTEKPYENIDVVDRLGSGDAYVSGALFGLLQYDDPQKAVSFGNATSSLKNTIPGDLPSSDFKEVSRIIHEHTATGPVSEMNR